jgi:hypothetical protein
MNEYLSTWMNEQMNGWINGSIKWLINKYVIGKKRRKNEERYKLVRKERKDVPVNTEHKP